MSLMGQKILLGVSAGIAAYKSCELVRRLIEAGAEVRVVMTRSATEFVTPLTFQALSGHPVRTELFDAQAEAGMDHIELARWPDQVLIAPATADLMARLAHGLADDLLTTVCLATRAPIALAPAMNQGMWSAPATQRNLRLLDELGYRLYGPGSGEQACGEVGPGRMWEPQQLLEALQASPAKGPLAGLHILLTAGPTREPIDPVRYLSNRSSGRMGFALAIAARRAGAQVTLVHGPVAIPAPTGIEVVAVETAQQMHSAVMSRASSADVFIATAAVADYRLESPASEKIKKQSEHLQLELARTPDILAEVAALPRRPFVVGFAAETQQVKQHALAKLEGKQLDMIAANDVSAGQGFDHEDNALQVFWPGGELRLPRQSKHQLAEALLQLVAERLKQKS